MCMLNLYNSEYVPISHSGNVLHGVLVDEPQADFTLKPLGLSTRALNAEHLDCLMAIFVLAYGEGLKKYSRSWVLITLKYCFLVYNNVSL